LPWVRSQYFPSEAVESSGGNGDAKGSKHVGL